MPNIDELAELNYADRDPQFYDDTQDLIDADTEERANQFQMNLYSKLEEVCEAEINKIDEDALEWFLKNEQYDEILGDLQQVFERIK